MDAPLSHLASEFYAWTWWASEREGCRIDLGGQLGVIDFWVDDRITFRDPDDDKPRAVLTGESPSTTPEARAALGGGRVVKEIKLGLRREDREFVVGLRGKSMDLAGVKLPQMISGGAEEVLYDRMALYEELHAMLAGIFARFADERTAPAWREESLPAMRAWVAGG